MKQYKGHYFYALLIMDLGPSSRFLKTAFALVLIVLVLPLFIPLTPKMPASGVDPAWALGLNQAVAQGLAFGKEIIFTLGPYSAIYTKFYHPATDSMMLWGSLYLACIYCLAQLLLMEQGAWVWRLVFGVFLLCLVYAKDALFFSYPLVLNLLVFHHLQKNKNLTDFKEVVGFIVLFSPLGLLPLIKGSFLILCGLTGLLSSLGFLYYRHYLLSYVALFSPLVSLLFFWLVGGQKINDLIFYIISSLSMVFSFTEAMSIQGNAYEVLTYLISSIFILFLILKEPLSKFSRFFLFCAFFFFLFLSFKAGFTRHFGHAFIAGTSLLIAALLLPFCARSRWLMPLVVLSFISSLYIEGNNRQINLAKNIQSTYSAASYGLIHRIKDKDWLKNNFILTMNYFKMKNALPVIKGKTDIYSYEQTDLIASGNIWSPRPILQSYSVFNASLAKINEAHLLGAHSPASIFFKLQPIDNRWPSLEEGSSWPIFLKNYYISTWVNGFLVLLKTKPSSSYELKLITQEHHSLGERVYVPRTKQLVFLQLDLNPTWLVQIVGVLFKLPELTIKANLRNGEEKSYRLISQMAKSPFLLTPLIENTQEFSFLYHAQEDKLLAKQIASFSIETEPNSRASLLWNTLYVAKFSVLM